MPADTLVPTADALYALSTEIIRSLPRDMSLTSVATLSTLDRLGSRRVTELAASEGVTQPSMTVLITSLEKLGYVRRVPDATDRRATLIELTTSGADYIRKRRSAGSESVALALSELDDADRVAVQEAGRALELLREVCVRHRRR